MDMGIIDRKGFPESYDMELLASFLYEIKNGKSVDIPIYSHEEYDILADQTQTVAAPDILIVEGINVFQNPSNQILYISDFYDFSIYVDAETDDIERWYLERFESLLELAKDDPNNFYHQWIDWPREKIMGLARDTWHDVNLVNLVDYIQPTRNRAEVILHKDGQHCIDTIYLKKY
jgi:type I pantothenate kinase